MDLNAHAHAIERARAYLQRIPADMEAAAVIRALLDGLEYEQTRADALDEEVVRLKQLLREIDRIAADEEVVRLARKGDYPTPGAYA